jgi:putative spermidine/putrescine transport system ATP-binding protein
MSALTFSQVRKTFGATVALESFDLNVQQGEFISLLGPSGCGKTTALRIAAGFETADSGSVSVSSRDITKVPPHQRNMGMVFQSYSLFPNLTVRENVEFGLRTRKLGAVERSTRSSEMLELVELGPLAGRFPHQLSGGQQQRVALARALAVQPEVLLLDEPLSALDAKVRGSLRDEIKRLQRSLGITTLFVTHDQEEALALADRVGVLSNGRLEQLDVPREIYRRPVNAFVARFVGSMNEFPATVKGPAQVDIAGATFVLSEHGARGMRSAASAQVTVLVRPEDVTVSGGLSAHQPGPGQLSGEVVLCSFLGATMVLAVRVEGLTRPVEVCVPGALDGVGVGDRVTLGIDTARALVEA